jgi:3-isopropylmalate/(R)-2-methylmalate dehydratase small subunit
MEPFVTHRGVVAILDRENIDTDQIIPKQHLKRIERSGFGAYLFSDWRYDAHGSRREDFVLNQEHGRSASILVAGKNFGCGSSREHAAWALMDYGFRAIIALSFADIFRNNAGSNGLLVIEVEAATVQMLAQRVRETAGYELDIDLQTQIISDDFGARISFALEPSRRHRLLNGLDEIGITLTHEPEIAKFEERVQPLYPVLKHECR